MKRFAYFFVLLLMASVPILAETLKNLPMPTGSYQVGIAKYDLTDSSRKEIEYPKYGRVMVTKGGHSANDPAIAQALATATDLFAEKMN